MLDPYQQVFQGIVAGIDAPYDIVHSFHQQQGTILDLAHREQGLTAVLLLQGQVAQDGDGAQRGADIVMQVLGDLIADGLHPGLQQLIGLQLLDQSFLALYLLFFGSLRLIAQPGREAEDLQHYPQLRKHEYIRHAHVQVKIELQVTEDKAQDIARRHEEAAGDDKGDQGLSPPVHIDYETRRQQEYHEQDKSIDLRLQLPV